MSLSRNSWKSSSTSIPADSRNWKPDSWEGIPSEPFSAIEQICHVRDIEVDGYHERFRRALQETNPTLENVDGETLAVERAYAAAEPAESLCRIPYRPREDA